MATASAHEVHEPLASMSKMRVVASAPSFAPVNGATFSAMLPPDAFRPGANRLEIFEWLGGLAARRIYG